MATTRPAAVGSDDRRMVPSRRHFWVFAGFVLAVWGVAARAATPTPTGPKADATAVRLTIEVSWTTPPLPAPPITPLPQPPPAELELTEGHVVEAVAWPGGPGSEPPLPGPKPSAIWRLGAGGAGRVRARIEAPPGASVVVRAGGQAARFPIATILEGTPPPPTPGAPSIRVERLAWDSLEVRLVEGDSDGDGTVTPGATVPVTVGLNVLSPEPGEVALRLTAELRPARGGEPVWRAESREVVATDARPVPTHEFAVVAPKVEGTYLLDLHASWEPTGKATEGTRLSRWVRRHREAPAASATRRVALTVVDDQPPTPPTPGKAETVVDSPDPGRLRGSRPAASGRSPATANARGAWTIPPAALVEADRRDRLRGWIVRGEAEGATLAPADASGLAWSAVGLRVPRPDRPHRLTLTVIGGHPSALGVAVVAPGMGSNRPRVVLDACASAPPILDGDTPATFSWLVWPGAAEPVLVVVNRGGDSAVRLGPAELQELADLPGPPPLTEPPDARRRALGLLLTGPDALDHFGGLSLGGDGAPEDTLATARNLASYLIYSGASTVVLTEGLADRSRRTALEGQAGEDATGPDRLDLTLRILARRGLSAWVEVRGDGLLPGLPSPGSAEAFARGLVRVDHRGRPDGPEPAYFPLNPEVRAAMARKIALAIAPRKTRPNLSGVLIRLGSGVTLPGGPESGLDDATFGRFARAMFTPEVAKGLKGLAPEPAGRFAARAEFVGGPGRQAWLTWRSRELGVVYDELTVAARQAAPGALLAVATPGLDDGPAGRQARVADGAGASPTQAWRALGLDFKAWPSGPQAPIVLRGAGLADDDLGRDLAASPDLDDQVAARPTRGLLLADPEPPPLGPALDGAAPALRLVALPLPEGPAGADPLGHGLAALDARYAWISAAAVAGQEGRIRQFARVFRALPIATDPTPATGRLPSGVVVRSVTADDESYVAMLNDTPYPILLEATLDGPADALVDDLGRGLRLAPESVPGGRRLVLELPAFGVAGVRVGAPGVHASAVIPHHPPATLAGLEAQAGDLSARLVRLAHAGAGAGSVTGPLNPGFEPEADDRAVTPVAAGPPRGWTLTGDPANILEIDPDRPHSGLGSLRVEAKTLPASVASEPFTPPGGDTLASPHAWLRSDRPDARVRAWVEGQAGGQPVARSVEIVVPATWTSLVPRGDELSTAGLRSARLRFELLTPGRLWIDDISLDGPLAEPDRANARRTLGAALQAYRERRFADFARLANSRWARRVEPGPGPNASATRPGPRQSGRF